MLSQDILHCCACPVMVFGNKRQQTCEHSQDEHRLFALQEEGAMGTARLVAGAGAGALAAVMAAQVGPHLAIIHVLGC